MSRRWQCSDDGGDRHIVSDFPPRLLLRPNRRDACRSIHIIMALRFTMWRERKLSTSGRSSVWIQKHFVSANPPNRTSPRQVQPADPGIVRYRSGPAKKSSGPPFRMCLTLTPRTMMRCENRSAHIIIFSSRTNASLASLHPTTPHITAHTPPRGRFCDCSLLLEKIFFTTAPRLASARAASFTGDKRVG